MSQFAGDISWDLKVIISYQDTTTAVRALPLFLRFCVHGHDLVRLQMTVTFAERHLEAGAMLTVRTVESGDSPTVHMHDIAAEVQADARTLHVEDVRGATLVEPFKKLVGLLLLEAGTGIGDAGWPCLCSPRHSR